MQATLGQSLEQRDLEQDLMPQYLGEDYDHDNFHEWLRMREEAPNMPWFQTLSRCDKIMNHLPNRGGAGKKTNFHRFQSLFNGSCVSSLASYVSDSHACLTALVNEKILSSSTLSSLPAICQTCTCPLHLQLPLAYLQSVHSVVQDSIRRLPIVCRNLLCLHQRCRWQCLESQRRCGQWCRKAWRKIERRRQSDTKNLESRRKAYFDQTAGRPFHGVPFLFSSSRRARL